MDTHENLPSGESQNRKAKSPSRRPDRSASVEGGLAYESGVCAKRVRQACDLTGQEGPEAPRVFDRRGVQGVYQVVDGAEDVQHA